MKKLTSARIPTKAPHVIGVFAPSEPLTSARYTRVLANARAHERRGFTVMFGPDIRRRLYAVAGTPQIRSDCIHALLANPSVHSLAGAWGGKGCIDLLNQLDYTRFTDARKPVFGVSDVAVLLNAIAAKARIVTFLGPNVFGKLDESPPGRMEFLRDRRLMSRGRDLFHGLRGLSTIIPGTAEGYVVGGSIGTFIHANLGTEYMLPPPHILVLESSTYDYQILRQQMTCLRLRGAFTDATGIVIGDLGARTPNGRWPSPSKRLFIREFFSDLGKPVLYAPVFGHGTLPSPVIAIGARAQLDATEKSLALLDDVISNGA